MSEWGVNEEIERLERDRRSLGYSPVREQRLDELRSRLSQLRRRREEDTTSSILPTVLGFGLTDSISSSPTIDSTPDTTPSGFDSGGVGDGFSGGGGGTDW